MPKKKKYENAEIVKGILARESNSMNNLELCMIFKALDLKKEKDRKFLSDNIKIMIEIFQEALKELEEI